MNEMFKLLYVSVWAKHIEGNTQNFMTLVWKYILWFYDACLGPKEEVFAMNVWMITNVEFHFLFDTMQIKMSQMQRVFFLWNTSS